MSTICRAIEVSRSNLYTQLPKNETPKRRKKFNKKEDDLLVGLIKEVLKERPTYGYRRITIILRKKLGIAINHKRVYRVMKENQLLLQRYAPKPLRVHDGKVTTLRSNLRWCSDIFAIQCWNEDKVTVAFAQDCHDREIISWIASSKGIDGSMVRDLMTESLESRFGKASKIPHALQWLSDNGPQYIARETIHFGRLLGLEICTTAPYSPESNGMAEAFVKTFKRDYVAFGDLSSAQKVIEQLPLWFEDYNEKAPHKGLKMLSPREYRRQLAA
jgi:transposase InsO family protein